MKIKFSRHAKRQMKWRKINENELRVAITNPDKLEDTLKGRKNAFKSIGGRILKITYKTENDNLLIITAISKGE